MQDIEKVFQDISKDCKNMLETNFYQCINIIGDEERCKKFLEFFNNFTNKQYQDMVFINQDGKESKVFYNVFIDCFYDIRAIRGF